jgi:nicotinamidase/pyrazinamidase
LVCRTAQSDGVLTSQYAADVVTDVVAAQHARPDPSLTYDVRTALLVIDIQNDFSDPSGSLHVPGGTELVDLANAHIHLARRAGAKVAYSQDWHPEETPHFASHGGPWPEHCVRGTWGAQFHPGLVLAGEVIQKGVGGEDGYSAFSVRDPVTGEERLTRLATVLRAAGIDRVVIIGLALDYCVVETAVDAVRLGFETIVLRDGVRPVDLQPGDGARAIERLLSAGADVR